MPVVNNQVVTGTPKNSMGLDQDFYKFLQDRNYLSGTIATNPEYFQRKYGEEYEQYKLQNKVDDRYKEITDFNSDYYKQYGSLLQKLTPGIGVNTLMSPLRAGGFNPTSAKNLAGNRARTLSSDRDEAISTATMQFAIGSQNQGNSLLGLYSQNQQFNQTLAEQKRQFNESQPTFGDSLLNVAGGIGGMALGNFLSPQQKPFTGGSGSSNYAWRYGK